MKTVAGRSRAAAYAGRTAGRGCPRSLAARPALVSFFRPRPPAFVRQRHRVPGAADGASVDRSLYTDAYLEIEVTDTGGAKDSPPVQSNGRGHMGLRERLAVYKGELTAGPMPTDGYRVTARIPRSAV
ncbi:hypothetical protein ACGFZB_38180 [Streptomyces cinerochromogenes]|uniref:Uncharacterized protein n=1 Tax=Streptomyces cinerochromogenes TaxID=66422 RepID=A0ABW7BJC5_9ACTN